MDSRRYRWIHGPDLLLDLLSSHVSPGKSDKVEHKEKAIQFNALPMEE